MKDGKVNDLILEYKIQYADPTIRLVCACREDPEEAIARPKRTGCAPRGDEGRVDHLAQREGETFAKAPP